MRELTEGVTFTEAHFLAALQRKNSEIINDVASRFVGKVEFDRELFTKGKAKLNIDLVAEKLVRVNCLQRFIIRERNYNLFQRLGEETHFERLSFDAVIFRGYDRRLAEIYLSYRTIPRREQARYYARIGEEFVKLLESSGVTLSVSVQKKRLNDEERDLPPPKRAKLNDLL